MSNHQPGIAPAPWAAESPFVRLERLIAGLSLACKVDIGGIEHCRFF